MRWRPPRAPMRPFPLMCSLLGLLASTACAPIQATSSATQLQIPVAASLRQPCPRPDRPTAPDVGALAAFSVRQEGAESVCEARKDAAVGVIDAANSILAQVAAQLRPKPWWERLW